MLEHVTVTRYVTPLREKACTEGPLSGRPPGERFRWLTAPRSTIVQPGPVHGGLTHLFDTLVRVAR